MSSKYQTFAQWRSNLDSFSKEARHTVECVLEVVEKGNGRFLALNSLTYLDLSSQQITDISPLSDLQQIANR